MAIRETLTIDDAISFLNSLLKIDPRAISNLVETRVLCNEELLNHPTVQVKSYGGVYSSVGILGILNGLFGTEPDMGGPIAAIFDVVCPNCGKEDGQVGDICYKNCGEKLILGPLVKFVRRLT